MVWYGCAYFKGDVYLCFFRGMGSTFSPNALLVWLNTGSTAYSCIIVLIIIDKNKYGLTIFTGSITEITHGTEFDVE